MKTGLFYTLICFFIYSNGWTQVLPSTALLKEKAPSSFQAEFITTKGSFTLEVIREWSPLGADRIFHLINSGFYNNNSIFRVQTGYVVQFGISDSRQVNEYWDHQPIADEPVKTSNLKGTVSFARDGANSRTAQLFINLKDNLKLDTVNFNGLHGFPPVGKIISEFEVVEQFYSGYGFEPANHQDSLMVMGNNYMKRKFPELDYIISVKLIKK